MLKRIGSGLAIVGFVPAPIAYAHRQKRGITTMEWVQDAKTLEITHIFHLFDAEQALAKAGILKAADLGPLRARATFALYVDKHFQLRGLDGKPLPVEIVGAEIDGGHIYVYQELPLKSAPKGFYVEDSILQDVYYAQVNLVSLIVNGHTTSVQFVTGDPLKKLLA